MKTRLLKSAFQLKNTNNKFDVSGGFITKIDRASLRL